MYDFLIRYFNSYSSRPLSADETDTIQRHFILKKIRKRQYFLQEGDVCKSLSFILQGAMRQYWVDEKGEEHVINLFIENWWASDPESLMNQTPSTYFIDAWEDSETLIVTKSDFTKLVYQIPPLTEWFKKYDTNTAIESQRRINAAISLCAEDRFYDLQKSRPEFLQRFPQHIIASYLGINRETLSRIRSRAVRRSL